MLDKLSGRYVSITAVFAALDLRKTLLCFKGAEAVYGTAQVERMYTSGRVSSEPSQVRSDGGRGEEDSETTAHKGGREGTDQPHLPCRLHG